jgi:ribonuclease HI
MATLSSVRDAGEAGTSARLPRHRKVVEGPKSDLLVFVDGGIKTAPYGDLGVAAVVCTPAGELLVESAWHAGHGSANLAEYRALAYGVGLAHLAGARRPLFCSDSALVVQQLNGWWARRNIGLEPEFVRCRSALMEFDLWWLKHIPRERNRRADWLVCRLLGHSRTARRAPKIEPVATEAKPRLGWSLL